ncbi:hypothetical protein M9H77_08670 [Catharanthus roseus]|uniref:Uncharacterized protein n=1 Tax=Catharanthus roseus TaxID=4058 RepID=A0ACC0BYH7_CATRO|nr:hypothetical protein M9H77_08670 [Catharanthus roseus]
MEQLLSMGFSEELAAEALLATDADVLRATDWILSRFRPPFPSNQQEQQQNSRQEDVPAPVPSSNSSPPNFQLKINRFFHSTSESQSQAMDEPLLTVTPSSTSTSSGRKKRLRPYAEPPSQPLYERMRPRTLDDIVGQDHILGPNSVIQSAIECNRLPSILLWGPPGTGKTSIAGAIVNSCCSTANSYRFVSLSAVNSGVKDVRDAVDEARKWRKTANKRTVLFIDEVHRFNKAQQDSFLPVIEDGSVVFMGATTENPSFHLITPLLSRCRVLVLNPLKTQHIKTLLKRAASDLDKGLCSSILSPVGAGKMMIEVDNEAMEYLSAHCDGDARVALNVLEISATTAAARLGRSYLNVRGNGEEREAHCNIDINDVKEALQCKHIVYDRAGDEHYNLISALHKSMRGSDADASIYWLARMLEGGEEPLYIARRLIRFACEDVGLADPSALPQAVACYQACHFIGMPECNVVLAQCVTYLALAPKSVSVYKAIEAAQKVVRESVGQNQGVPLHLRNAPTKLMKDLGFGKGYMYPPDNTDSSSSQTYFPPALQGYKFLDWPNDATNG